MPVAALRRRGAPSCPPARRAERGDGPPCPPGPSRSPRARLGAGRSGPPRGRRVPAFSAQTLSSGTRLPSWRGGDAASPRGHSRFRTVTCRPSPRQRARESLDILPSRGWRGGRVWKLQSDSSAANGVPWGPS